MEFRVELTVIDGVTTKGKSVIIPVQLQQQAIDQLYNNNKHFEKNEITIEKSP